MCTQAPPHNHAPKLYERYSEVMREYIDSKVQKGPQKP